MSDAAAPTRLDNPLFSWGLIRLRQDRRALLGSIIFGVLFYGAVALALLVWGASFRRDVEQLLTSFFYIAWTANGLVLLLGAPARIAQGISQSRAQGTLDMLRLTGLSGLELALGQVGASLLLPLGLCLLTAPVALLGLGAEGGPLGTLRAYLGLIPLALVYTVLAGLVGLSVKKPQHAASTAIFVLLGLLVASAVFNFMRVPEVRPLALLGPWGSGMTTLNRLDFVLLVFGVETPGELLQLPFHLTLLAALVWGLSQRLSGRPAALMGPGPAYVVAGAIALVSGLTFFPEHETGPWWQQGPSNRAVLAGHLLLVFFAMLLPAAEAAVRSKDLLRGMARRGRGNLPRPEERLTVLRFLPGLLIPVGMGALLGFGILIGNQVSFSGRAPEVTLGGLLVGTLLLVVSWTLSSLAFQVVQLATRDRGAPRILTAVALCALWIVPFIASFALRQAGASAELFELPRTLSPLYGLYAAAFSTDSSATASSLAPLAVASASVLLYGFGCAGLLHLLRILRGRVQERAEGLVALPADAYGAPGSLTERCPKGHLYSGTWARCPHCEPEAEAPTEGDPL